MEYLSLWGREIPNTNFLAPLLTLALALLPIIAYWYAATTTRSPTLPPGPRGLPLLGHLPFLDPNLHRYFAHLSLTHGPIFSLRLGRKLVVVVNSPSLAKEVLKDQDATFANRDIPNAILPLPNGTHGMGWAPNGPQWRMLRKLAVSELLNAARLNAFHGLNQREVARMMGHVYSEAESPVQVRKMIYGFMFNVVTGMLWGGETEEEERDRVGSELAKVVAEILDDFGRPNVSDFFPILARFDVQGVARRMKDTAKEVDRIFDSMIDGRLRKGGLEEEDEKRDFLRLLLQIEKKGDPKMALTRANIKAVIMDLVMAGIETTTSITEWAMAELMHHPEIMIKARAELHQVVGPNTLVEETHLPKLHYLNAVFKEVIRLYPAAPLMLPRSPSQTSIVGGYTVPAGCQVLVNVWAIQRDPKAWDNPSEFQPERFLTGARKWDFGGNDFHYFPFGAGRRICPGISVAERLLLYALASLLHSFDWKVAEGAELRLTEQFAVTLRKAEPLVAVPTPRFANPELYGSCI